MNNEMKLATAVTFALVGILACGLCYPVQATDNFPKIAIVKAEAEMILPDTEDNTKLKDAIYESEPLPEDHEEVMEEFEKVEEKAEEKEVALALHPPKKKNNSKVKTTTTDTDTAIVTATAAAATAATVTATAEAAITTTTSASMDATPVYNVVGGSNAARCIDWLNNSPDGQFLSAYCAQVDADKYIVTAIICHESNFIPSAYNPSGATGYMQILPAYANGYNLYNGQENIKRGIAILQSWQSQAGGNLRNALAMYAGGYGGVNSSECLNYADWVIALADQIR